MALPLSPMPAAAPAAPLDMAPPANDMPMEDTGEGEWVSCCEILKNSTSGEYKLVSASAEGGEMGEGDGQVYADGPALLRGVMEEIGGGADEAEEQFTSATKGGSTAKMPVADRMPPEGP